LVLYDIFDYLVIFKHVDLEILPKEKVGLHLRLM